MATKQLLVLQAAKALVSAALPAALVVGFDKDADKPTRIGPHGCAVGHPGDAGEPEVDLSPLTYNYSHRIAVELIGPDGKGGDDLDPLLTALADAAAANPTLNDLCDWFGIQSPDLNDRSAEGLPSTNWATVWLVAEYSTNNALR